MCLLRCQLSFTRLPGRLFTTLRSVQISSCCSIPLRHWRTGPSITAFKTRKPKMTTLLTLRRLDGSPAILGPHPMCSSQSSVTMMRALRLLRSPWLGFTQNRKCCLLWANVRSTWIGTRSTRFLCPRLLRKDCCVIVRSPFRAKHHVVMQYMAAGPKCPLPPPRRQTPPP